MKALPYGYVIRKKFWTQLLDYAKAKTRMHANISPSDYSWVGTGAGLRGLGFNYSITKHTSAVELYIDRGKDTEEENKSIFQQLANSKDEVEQVFGDKLEWQQLEGKRACRIKKQFALGGYRDDDEKWPQIHEAMVDAMILLEKALKPHIKAIKI